MLFRNHRQESLNRPTNDSTRPTWVWVALFAFSITMIASTARATNGVVEINQTCAVQTGCFANDPAGYPVTIVSGSDARSYRLTSDLIVPDANTTGIQVLTPSISIDLNGFEIVRAGCEGAAVSCRISGAGYGVDGNGRLGISVVNGSITGMGNDGVNLGLQAEVSRLRVRFNGDIGIFATGGSNISDNTVHENGTWGILTTVGSIVLRNSLYLNSGNGIESSHAAIISDNAIYKNGGFGIRVLGNAAKTTGNTVYENGLDGINVGSGSTVMGNSAWDNGGVGIRVGIGAMVKNNASRNNASNGIDVGAGSTVTDNTSYFNTGDGIIAGTGSTAKGNTVRSNSGYGLRCGAQTAYRENVITNNGTGTVFAGVNMLGNSCNGTSTCP